MYTTAYAGNNSGRGPSGFWADCPWEQIGADPNCGCRFEDDFTTFPTKIVPTTVGPFGNYNVFSSATGSIITTSVTAGFGGKIALGCTADNESISIASGTHPFIINSSSGKIWFEARLAFSSIANTIYDVFIGLCESVTQIVTVPLGTTTGTTVGGVTVLSDNNMVGFLHPGGAISGAGGSTLTTAYKANGVTAVNVQNAVATLVAATYVKVGFSYDPSTNILTYYVNGTPCTTTYTMASAAGTDFPNDVNLGPMFAVMDAVGSNTATVSLDWWRGAQRDIASIA